MESASDKTNNVLAEIRAEREKQYDKHNFKQDHDDQYTHDELKKASMCYIVHTIEDRNGAYTMEQCIARENSENHPKNERIWPWSLGWWRPEKTIRATLIKAMALLVAEIERIDRVEEKNNEPR